MRDKKEHYLKLAERVRTWRKRHPERSKAHKIVYVEVRARRLKKKKCKCGKVKVEAHHEDYSKPLEVIWLCRKHHQEADRRLKDRQHKLPVPKDI